MYHLTAKVLRLYCKENTSLNAWFGSFQAHHLFPFLALPTPDKYLPLDSEKPRITRGSVLFR